MELLKNIAKNDHGEIEGEVWFGLFNKYISFFVEDSANIDYISKCAQFINNLSDEVIDKLCESSIRYCNSFLECIGEPTKSFVSSRDIIPLTYPSVLIIPYSESDNNEPILHMELNCEWEPEHGMEWIVRKSEVLYVGAFQGENPWGDFSDKESWNYA